MGLPILIGVGIAGVLSIGTVSAAAVICSNGRERSESEIELVLPQETEVEAYKREMKEIMNGNFSGKKTEKQEEKSGKEKDE
ncbi:unnamed protein product [Caenorhabditis brenneri]